MGNQGNHHILKNLNPQDVNRFRQFKSEGKQPSKNIPNVRRQIPREFINARPIEELNRRNRYGNHEIELLDFQEDIKNREPEKIVIDRPKTIGKNNDIKDKIRPKTKLAILPRISQNMQNKITQNQKKQMIGNNIKRKEQKVDNKPVRNKNYHNISYDTYTYEKKKDNNKLRNCKSTKFNFEIKQQENTKELTFINKKSQNQYTIEQLPMNNWLKLKSLTITKSSIKDKTLFLLNFKYFPKLKHLNLSDNLLSWKTIQYLGKNKDNILVSLILDRNSLFEKRPEIDWLSCLFNCLKILSLVETKINHPAIDQLVLLKMPKLQHLNLSLNIMNQIGLSKLEPLMKKLHTLTKLEITPKQQNISKIKQLRQKYKEKQKFPQLQIIFTKQNKSKVK